MLNINNIYLTLLKRIEDLRINKTKHISLIYVAVIYTKKTQYLKNKILCSSILVIH